ncbi:MAG: maltose ABC transporter permease MalF, partial [Burkholderiales bacterium]|nr:maltose ABC transporter permease MalF [Burkholderiales bacterium]
PAPAAAGGAALTLRAIIARLPALRALKLRLPDGPVLSLLSLREYARLQPLYRAGADGSIEDRLTGTAYRPDAATGFYTSADGRRLRPGYRVGVGLAHYRRIFGSESFRRPFVGVFAWTIAFAALSVLFAAGLGLFLAVLLNWEELRLKGAYRLVLFLPYAVPGFISILIFKGLFNQNLGEINVVLHGLFGIRPAWFSDPMLARTMLLIVNTWLGFPYMMVLCTGLIQAIPADLYEASAVAGAGPWANFRSITLPLILQPLKPLLISTFAFNFNNFVLISLLTGGRPDQVDTALPAGTTDILVSYTWRIAFQDSGQQFGLAAAISTVIFAIVAAITLVQLRYTRITADEPRR